MGLFGGEYVERALWAIRSMRASPPGQAGSARRGNVFQAAIQQFEELLRTGGAIGPSSSPILMYYALNQAGRAILAAHGPNDAWDVHGHGLSVNTARTTIGDTVVRPTDAGLFQAVATAVGSSAITGPLRLSEAWAGVPRFQRARGLGDDAAPMFRVGTESGKTVVRSAVGGPIPFPEFWDTYESFPGGEGAVFDPISFSNPGLEQMNAFRLASFSDDESQREFSDSLVTFDSGDYMRIPMGEGADQPSGLMTLWIVLIALSSLARYEPAGWTAALAPKSELAVPIEQSLSEVPLALANLVHDALVQGNDTGVTAS